MSKKQQMQYYEELAKKSLKETISLRSSMRRSFANQIRKMKKILELGKFRTKDLILDLGCGECLELIALKDKDVEIVAVDLSSNLLRVAINSTGKYNLKIDFINADSDYLPFKSNIFNHSFCIALLHHVMNPSTVIEEMNRVTRRSGNIIIVEKNLLNPICWIDVFKQWSLEKGTFKVTKRRLIENLKTSGLTNLAIEPIVAKPDPEHPVKNFLRKILGILERSRSARKIISSTYAVLCASEQ